MQFKLPITITGIEVYPIRARGGVSPKMALAAMPTRPALLVRVLAKDGCFGWGEVWANFPPRANIHKAHIIEDVVASHLKNLCFVEPREVQAALRHQLSVYFLHVGQLHVFEHILAGIDTALWDLALRAAGVSFAGFMGLESTCAQTYATSINSDDLNELIPKHASLGQTHFKLKIGFAEHGVSEIVQQAASICPNGSQIMVDSNQSWTLQEAKDYLKAIEEFSPYFAEEPLRANAPPAHWEELARATNIPLAGGENIYGLADFVTMANAGMQVLQPDVAKWGGVSGALALSEIVTDDIQIWPHFMGAAVGQYASLAVTGAIGDGSSCEVDVNSNALRTQLCGDVMHIEDGCVALPTQPGLVVPPQQQCLRMFTDAYS